LIEYQSWYCNTFFYNFLCLNCTSFTYRVLTVLYAHSRKVQKCLFGGGSQISIFFKNVIQNKKYSVAIETTQINILPFYKHAINNSEMALVLSRNEGCSQRKLNWQFETIYKMIIMISIDEEGRQRQSYFRIDSKIFL